jgi:hypothetical protein
MSEACRCPSQQPAKQNTTGDYTITSSTASLTDDNRCRSTTRHKITRDDTRASDILKLELIHCGKPQGCQPPGPGKSSAGRNLPRNLDTTDTTQKVIEARDTVLPLSRSSLSNACIFIVLMSASSNQKSSGQVV